MGPTNLSWREIFEKKKKKLIKKEKDECTLLGIWVIARSNSTICPTSYFNSAT